MTAINQRIPNFLGGVSQQPDFIKFPGQLRTCHNAYPDVTFGLQKRAPGEYVGRLATATDGGEWFEILRDNDEKYLIHIIWHPDVKRNTAYVKGDTVLNDGNKVYKCVVSGTTHSSVGHPSGTGTNIQDGTCYWDYSAILTNNYSGNRIRVWDLADGSEKTVNFTNGAINNFNYLNKQTSKPYGKLTINDYTLITNPEKTVSTARTTPTFEANYAFLTLNEIAYNSEYVVSLGTSSLNSTTKYRVQSLKVVKHGTDSSTWSTDSPDAVYTGSQEFVGTTGVWKDVKFTVTVNASHFVQGYTNPGNPDQHIANYDTAYTGTVTLQDTGENLGSNWQNQSQVVNVNGQNWTVTITSVNEYQSYTDSNAAVYRTPLNIKKGELTKDLVLGNIKKAITDKYHGQGSNTVEVSVAGNGLYIKANYAFGTIGVRGGLAGDSLEAFTDKAQNISKLPGTCKDGYIVKVSNTEDATADDYYVKFITDTAGGIGSGIWEETVAPGIVGGVDEATMPHALINNRDGTFTWTSLKFYDNNGDGTNDYTAVGGNYWVDRQVGDDNTNPMPTFVGQKITNLFFVRNRLGLLSGEQVIISQPADYFNFFIGSAIAASDSDPIDMGASDVKPAILNYALPMQKGVMLFSEAAQFMLFTESENFSPKTAQLKKLSSYESTADFSPVDTGTAVMFASNSSSYSKIFELILTGENTPPKVIEQTRVIPEFVPNDINRITNSAQAGVVTFGKIGDSKLYHYKYFDGGQQREQSSWFSWELQGNLVHQLYTSGNFYSITKQGGVGSPDSGDFILNRYELIVDATETRAYQIGTGTVGSPTSIARRFECCLDNMMVWTGTPNDARNTPGLQVDWQSTNNRTVLTLPYNVEHSLFQLVYLTEGNVISSDVSSGATITFNGKNLSSIPFACGYRYTAEIGLPSYYLSKERGQYDVDADLRIHRLNFDLGVSGPLEFHITSPQRADYIHEETGIIADIGSLNKVPSQLYKNISIPIYKKNNKHDVTIKIPDPFTATIVSASWDGSYNSRRHARQ